MERSLLAALYPQAQHIMSEGQQNKHWNCPNVIPVCRFQPKWFQLNAPNILHLNQMLSYWPRIFVTPFPIWLDSNSYFQEVYLPPSQGHIPHANVRKICMPYIYVWYTHHYIMHKPPALNKTFLSNYLLQSEFVVGVLGFPFKIYTNTSILILYEFNANISRIYRYKFNDKSTPKHNWINKMLQCLIERKGILMRLCWVDLRIITLIILKYLSAEMIISYANWRKDK